MEQNFDSIRPYNDSEIHEVFERLKNEETFVNLITYIFPQMPTKEILDTLLNIKTIKEFQTSIIYTFVMQIINSSTKGVEIRGLEKLDKNKGYLFLSNHRDIVLDSAILNVMLVQNGFSTTEIAIGDNLLIFPWITDLVRLNRSFIVERNLPMRQQLESSHRLSAYIRHSLSNLNNSIWMAQREGRSKDGNDKTATALLKMIGMSSKNGSLSDTFAPLNIVPVSISYEYDPCDYLKAVEFQMKRDNPNYVKSQQDDLRHMGTGLRGRKGRVSFVVGDVITAEKLNEIEATTPKAGHLEAIAAIIDEQIHSNYKLWPGNFVAADELATKPKYSEHYTAEEKAVYDEYIREHMERIKIEADKDFIYHSLMEMYANPVKNFFK
ncbi:MAG: 1-acyl-sn-glycerol-3-phosphate acyltransferase [Breznakibacter sp.]|nr:1-acyl-sn-glycerol-3-phosphate acyltransferase [Breznakibacter sp.]